jgi:sterol desaturase/sphingolipid hydroxylase (fatty acid hydroxylase superfamily)
MLESLRDTVASFVVLAIGLWPLERAFAARPGQPLVRRPAWGLDLVFFLGQYLVWGPLAVFAIMSALPWLHPESLAGVREAVGRQPVWLQVVEATVLCDLCVYWWHRLCHEVPWLWRFHAVHHSVEHLDWLAAHREHPLDGLTTQFVCNLPAFVLGIPLAPLAMISAFRGMWAIFIHSNVRVRLGPVGFLFGAPELHHWHHARVDQTRHNFANLAPYMDWIFGTYHRPVGEERWELGLAEKFPRSYLGQLFLPLRAVLFPGRKAPEGSTQIS